MRDGLVPIGEFARASRLTIKALRHYHAVGLLAPARVDPSTGYRYYAWTQLADAVCVATLRDLDVPIDRIRAHLVDGVPLDRILAEERADLQRRAARAERALAVIDSLRGRSTLPRAEVDTVTRDETATLVAVSDVDADHLGTRVPALIGDVLDRAARHGVDGSAPVIGEYPLTLSGTTRVTLHLPVARLDPVDGLSPGRIPGGRFARAVHVGPHESLPLAYHALLGSLHAGGHTPSGPVYERYLDDPADTDPMELRTELLHPVG